MANNNQSLEWLASFSRKGSNGVDSVIGSLPTLPTRFALVAAQQDALGLVPIEDEETGEVELVQEEPTDIDDLTAVGFAALGLCWDQPTLKGAPTFRECGRDVVEYGEQIETVLWNQGYRNRDELYQASVPLLLAIRSSIFELEEETKAETRGFEEAQQSQ